MAIECTNDMKASNKILETAKAQFDEHRSLVTQQIDEQRKNIDRKISEKRHGRRLKSEAATDLSCLSISVDL